MNALTRYSKTESNEGKGMDKYYSIRKKLNKFDFEQAMTQAEQLKEKRNLPKKQVTCLTFLKKR